MSNTEVPPALHWSPTGNTSCFSLASKRLKGNAVSMAIISMLNRTNIKCYKLIDLSIEFDLTQFYLNFKELNAIRTY